MVIIKSRKYKWKKNTYVDISEDKLRKSSVKRSGHVYIDKT